MNEKIILKNRPQWLICLIIAFLAAWDGFIATFLVYLNDFAPDGAQGIATLIQGLTGISVGLWMVLINAPLLIFAFVKLSKYYALKNMIYVLVFSLISVLLRVLIEAFDLSFLQFKAESTEALFAIAIGYGIFNGVVYSLTVMMGGSTGGTDILAQIINYYNPHYNTVWILFIIKTTISISSFFVYGRRVTPVLLSIVCALACSTICDAIFKGQATALKFEIITEMPDELAKELMEQLGHGCTMINGKGMYEEKSRAVLICIVNKRQRRQTEAIINKYQETFAYCCPVKATYGYFDM